MNIDKRRTFAWVMIGAMGISTPSIAEQVIEEIVVTASKRDSKLQDIAGAVNVIGGDQITGGGGCKLFAI